MCSAAGAGAWKHLGQRWCMSVCGWFAAGWFAAVTGCLHVRGRRPSTSPPTHAPADAPSPEAVWTTSVCRVLVLSKAAYDSLAEKQPKQVRPVLVDFVL